jgi:hypothetical protein
MTWKGGETMGLRSAKRQIAKARMRAIGFEHVNKNFSVQNADGVTNWRLALTDKKAERLQLSHGFKAKRKIKRIERTA